MLKLTRLLIAAIFLTTLAPQAYALRLKIATLSPEGSMWMEKMRQGAQEVAKETNNRVTFKFYPGGVMGNDKAVIRKIRIGQLHGGAVIGGSLSSFFPANQLYAQPMKLKSQEEVDYIRKHLDAFIVNGLDEAGFVTFGLIGGGFAYIMSKDPIVTVADLKTRKVWIPDNDEISQGSIKAFGISPIPLPISDVRTSLQSGLIDTVATSPVGAIVLQWHTQIKYVTNIPLIYLHGVLAIDKKKFMKISAKDRQIVTQIMTRALKEIDTENRQDDLEAIEALKNRGIKFITPPEKDLKEWYRIAGMAAGQMVTNGVLPKDIVDKMDHYLEEFHKNNP